LLAADIGRPVEEVLQMSHQRVVGADRQVDRQPREWGPTRRRGKVTGTPITLRLQPELLAAIDKLRADTWTRPEAVRLIIMATLKKTGFFAA
jgi:hypothetical protein